MSLVELDARCAGLFVIDLFHVDDLGRLARDLNPCGRGIFALGEHADDQRERKTETDRGDDDPTVFIQNPPVFADHRLACSPATRRRDRSSPRRDQSASGKAKPGG